MSPILNQIPPVFDTQTCSFPMSNRRENGYISFRRVPIPLPDTANSFFVKHSLQRIEEVLQESWAILLHNYLGLEQVTFAVLADMYSSTDSIVEPESENFDIDGHISVLQYRIDGTAELEQVWPENYFKSSARDLKELKISSAVLYQSNISRQVDEARGKHLNISGKSHHDIRNIFDLILEVNNSQPYVGLSITYRHPAISMSYAQSIARSFAMILEAFTSGAVPNSIVNFIHEEDKRKMISWNPKDLYSQMSSMHHLVEATARVRQNSEAVCAWDGSLSYSQLDTISSLAAKRLALAGVVPGVYVPFLYEKSLWTVVAVLSILKAGGAFVPLDSSYPEARLQEILTATKAKVAVTSDLFAPRLSKMVESVVVISSRITENNSCSGKKTFYSAEVKPNDPIFVLFTSGSTGKPKGIVHEHKAICTHAIAHGEVMNYHNARVLQFAAHTFDVTTMDIFTTLIFGGCICIPSEEDRRGNVIKVINQMNVDYAILTPSFARLLRQSDVPTLKTLAIGGECLSEETLREWAEKISVIQIYGPAEVGICLCMQMRPDTEPEKVGYPLQNCTCWLVKPNDPNHLVPVGAVGELIVSGPSIARGYLDDESKDQSSFIENPHWARGLGLKYTRFFRTGDLLRYNTNSFDGSFDFVGRKDAQIKLRGQRLEPAEVEHCISNIEGVAVCMVTRPLQGCFAGDLVAIVEMCYEVPYQIRNEAIALADMKLLKLDTIERHLSKMLPKYMIPTVCLVVKCMPFVLSMKIDRRSVEAWLSGMQSIPTVIANAALLDLNTVSLGASEITANTLSNTVADIVAGKDTAKKVQLQKHDFILQATGINSIEIIELHMALQRLFPVKISVYQLLDSQLTIRQLAEIIDNRNESINSSQNRVMINLFQESTKICKELSETCNNQARSSDSTKKLVSIKNIFLTGASGYLGLAILHRLLKIPNTIVYALVRCSDENTGYRVLENSGRKSGWWRDSYKSRIRIWQGDLTMPCFGLNDEQWKCLLGNSNRIAHQIHAIIHNGAKVHYTSDYATLKATNITPTVELLRVIALSDNLSTFTYVSGGQKPDDVSLHENIQSFKQVELEESDGYGLTKCISEFIVRKCALSAIFRLKPLHTVKPGYIMGSLDLGLAQQRDFIWRLVASCVEEGAYNCDDVGQWLFIADVDVVADGIVNCAFDNGSSGQVKRILDGLYFSDIWDILDKDFGYKLKSLSCQKWMERLRGSVERNKEKHKLFPLMHVLERTVGKIGSVEAPPGDLATSRQRAREGVTSNIRHLISVGFIPEVQG